MIKITVSYNKAQILTLTVEGHAETDKKAINPACACVSNVMLGFLNWYENTPESAKLTKQIVKPGYIMLKVPADRQLQLILKVIIAQLKTTHHYFRTQIKWQVSR